jgi:hypothetical protein
MNQQAATSSATAEFGAYAFDLAAYEGGEFFIVHCPASRCAFLEIRGAHGMPQSLDGGFPPYQGVALVGVQACLECAEHGGCNVVVSGSREVGRDTPSGERGG